MNINSIKQIFTLGQDEIVLIQDNILNIEEINGAFFQSFKNMVAALKTHSFSNNPASTPAKRDLLTLFQQNNLFSTNENEPVALPPPCYSIQVDSASHLNPLLWEKKFMLDEQGNKVEFIMGDMLKTLYDFINTLTPPSNVLYPFSNIIHAPSCDIQLDYLFIWPFLLDKHLDVHFVAALFFQTTDEYFCEDLRYLLDYYRECDTSSSSPEISFMFDHPPHIESSLLIEKAFQLFRNACPHPGFLSRCAIKKNECGRDTIAFNFEKGLVSVSFRKNGDLQHLTTEETLSTSIRTCIHNKEEKTYLEIKLQHPQPKTVFFNKLCSSFAFCNEKISYSILDVFYSNHLFLPEFLEQKIARISMVQEFIDPGLQVNPPLTQTNKSLELYYQFCSFIGKKGFIFSDQNKHNFELSFHLLNPILNKLNRHHYIHLKEQNECIIPRFIFKIFQFLNRNSHLDDPYIKFIWMFLLDEGWIRPPYGNEFIDLLVQSMDELPFSLLSAWLTILAFVYCRDSLKNEGEITNYIIEGPVQLPISSTISEAAYHFLNKIEKEIAATHQVALNKLYTYFSSAFKNQAVASLEIEKNEWEALESLSQLFLTQSESHIWWVGLELTNILGTHRSSSSNAPEQKTDQEEFIHLLSLKIEELSIIYDSRASKEDFIAETNEIMKKIVSSLLNTPFLEKNDDALSILSHTIHSSGWDKNKLNDLKKNFFFPSIRTYCVQSENQPNIRHLIEHFIHTELYYHYQETKIEFSFEKQKYTWILENSSDKILLPIPLILFFKNVLAESSIYSHCPEEAIKKMLVLSPINSSFWRGSILYNEIENALEVKLEAVQQLLKLETIATTYLAINLFSLTFKKMIFSFDPEKKEPFFLVFNQILNACAHANEGEIDVRFEVYLSLIQISQKIHFSTLIDYWHQVLFNSFIEDPKDTLTDESQHYLSQLIKSMGHLNDQILQTNILKEKPVPPHLNRIQLSLHIMDFRYTDIEPLHLRLNDLHAIQQQMAINHSSLEEELNLKFKSILKSINFIANKTLVSLFELSKKTYLIIDQYVDEDQSDLLEFQTDRLLTDCAFVFVLIDIKIKELDNLFKESNNYTQLINKFIKTLPTQIKYRVNLILRIMDKIQPSLFKYNQFLKEFKLFSNIVITIHNRANPPQ